MLSRFIWFLIFYEYIHEGGVHSAAFLSRYTLYVHFIPFSRHFGCCIKSHADGRYSSGDVRIHKMMNVELVR